MSVLSNAPAVRRRACALALPGIPLALLVGSLIGPTDSTDNATQLAAAAAHGGRWQGAALCELLAAGLFPLAAAGVVRVARRRGATVAHLAALLAGLGSLGMAAIAFRHLFIYGLTAASRPAALDVLDRVDNHAGAVAMPLMIAGPFALLAVAGAAARSGLASRWTVAGAILFGISDSLPIPAAEEIQGAIGIVTFGAIAVKLLRLTDEQWEAAAVPERATAATAPRVAARAGA